VPNNNILRFNFIQICDDSEFLYRLKWVPKTGQVKGQVLRLEETEKKSQSRTNTPFPRCRQWGNGNLTRRFNDALAFGQRVDPIYLALTDDVSDVTTITFRNNSLAHNLLRLDLPGFNSPSAQVSGRFIGV
jgi:hypothetical protein